MLTLDAEEELQMPNSLGLFLWRVVREWSLLSEAVGLVGDDTLALGGSVSLRGKRPKI